MPIVDDKIVGVAWSSMIAQVRMGHGQIGMNVFKDVRIGSGPKAIGERRCE